MDPRLTNDCLLRRNHNRVNLGQCYRCGKHEATIPTSWNKMIMRHAGNFHISLLSAFRRSRSCTLDAEQRGHRLPQQGEAAIRLAYQARRARAGVVAFAEKIYRIAVSIHLKKTLAKNDATSEPVLS